MAKVRSYPVYDSPKIPTTPDYVIGELTREKKCSACHTHKATKDDICESCYGVLMHNCKDLFRRSGKTTRLVDQAVQHLFNTGTLYLVTTVGIYFVEKIHGIPDSEIILIDQDSRKNNRAQEDFIKTVLYRLKSEHEQCLEIKKEKYCFKVTKK